MKKLTKMKLREVGDLMNDEEMKWIVGGQYVTDNNCKRQTNGKCSGACGPTYVQGYLTPKKCTEWTDHLLVKHCGCI